MLGFDDPGEVFACRGAFDDFKNEVLEGARYSRSQPSSDFLSSVCEVADASTRLISPGDSFSRARIMSPRDVTKNLEVSSPRPGLIGKKDVRFQVRPFSSSEMVPVSKFAKSGRANAERISVLYAADCIHTAVLEVRAYKGANISIGEFVAAEEVRVVDFTHRRRLSTLSSADIFSSEVDAEVWEKIGSAFSAPMHKHDSDIEYVPTQIIAECIKSRGFDGLAYDSSVSDGVNYAFFDAAKFNCRKTAVVTVSGAQVSLIRASGNLLDGMVERQDKI